MCLLKFLVGDHKSGFIPDLVGPFLEMTLIPHSGKPTPGFWVVDGICTGVGRFSSMTSPCRFDGGQHEAAINVFL